MRSVPEICMPYTSYGVTITPWAVFPKRAFARFSNRMRAGTTSSTPTRSISAAGGMPEDLSASSFCKHRFCKNDIDPKIRVPSVPSVPRYGSTHSTRTFQSVSLLFFGVVGRCPVFGYQKSSLVQTVKIYTAGDIKIIIR